MEVADHIVAKMAQEVSFDIEIKSTHTNSIQLLDQFCCENGANNVDCCLNGGTGRYCCLNNATDANCTPNYACGTQIPLTQYTRPWYSQTPGLASGVYNDGTTLWAGVANFGACLGQNPAPGRLDFDINSSKGIGSYMACTSYLFSNLEVRYFYAHPNLKWVETTGVSALNVPGLVRLGGAWNFPVGKTSFDAPNITHSDFGKVWGNVLNYYNVDRATETTTPGPFEVLACQTCQNGGSGPYCCKNGVNSKNLDNFVKFFF
jgi:hypothetical protein